MSKLIKTAVLASFILVVSGCKKLLDIDPPKNELPSAVIFNSAETARGALSGAYSQLSGSQTYSVNLTLADALAADELRALSSSPRFALLQNNTYEAQNSSYISDIWGDTYTSIYSFNSIIERLTNNTVISEPIARQMRSEALAMRAYCYLQLVRHFGEVPLVITTNVNVSALLPKSSVTDVYNQIIQDLTEAKAGLSVAYATNAGVSGRSQVNQSVAAALLAQAYLATGNWQGAITNATEVINHTDLYELLPGNRLTDVFLAGSREAILQLGPALNATSGYTNEGQEFVSNDFTFALPYTLTNGLLNSFESNDLRRSAWVRAVSLDGVDASEPYKYQNSDNDDAVASGRNEAPTIIRLAEIYLIRAEANAALANTAATLADLNIIRGRAGLQPLSAGVNLSLAVEQERRVELFCEHGDRWLSLKRTGRVNAVIGALKPTWQPRAQLYPIPQTAIDANPNLTQNQGYR
ncbi:hypothetical protein A0256_14205 [Mucilaginibacter sp. PAMC 26640]|nr:hypothetical protein A0256_14205 [Mucilaginibacter sp. PAMC 26640]